MPLLGKIIVIKRNGTDGTHFPLTTNSCLFGRKTECDIRIQMPQVSKEHCKIEINENKEALLFNLSSTNPTQLNGSSFQDPTFLKHGDILTIIDRAFRFEYPSHSFLQKRLSKSQEKETLQVLHVQHLQQVELMCPQNSDCKSPLILGKRLENQALNSNERNQKQYRQHKPEKRELSPFSKLYELMKHRSGTGSKEEDSDNETCTGKQQKRHLPDGNSNLLEDAFQSPIWKSAVGQANLTEAELSESTNIERKDSIASNPISKSFEEKISEKSLDIQSNSIKQKQEYEDTGQSNFNVMEDNETEKSEVIKSANTLAVFKENQSANSPAAFYIASLDNTEKSRPLSKVNLKDTLTSVENTFCKPNINKKIDQTYSSPCSRNSQRSSKSRKSWVEIESIRMKFSEETECTYSKTNEIDKEMTTKSTQNLKGSEDGNSSTIFISLNNSKSCNCNIEPNKDISNECSYMEVIDTETSVLTLADPSKTGRIMPDQVPEQNLEPSWPTNDKGMKTTESHEQSIEMKNNIPDFSSPYESIQTLAKDDAVSEMNLSCPFSENKLESKKSARKRKGRELDTLIQPLGKRKRVSFGGQLSPELFDKRLPPNSPLKRGAIPARLSMPFRNSPRAVLKKASELKKPVIKGIPQSNQHENIVSEHAAWPHMSSDASCSVPQINECLSIPHVINLSSEDKDDLAQDLHVITDEKKTEFDEQKSKTASSLRRNKAFTPRRSSIYKNIGLMDGICAKRRSGASEANLIVAKSWAEVVKQGVPKPQLKPASKQGVKRSMKKKPRKSLKNGVLLKPPRRMSGHFTTGHANSPAPIVIGKARTGIVNIAAQTPKMVINYSLKEHESFTDKKPELELKMLSQQKLENQGIKSPVLKEESQIFVLEQDGLKIPKEANISEENLQETTIIGEEEKNQQQASVPVKVLTGVKRLLKTPKQKTEPVDALSGVKRLLRTPKQKTEPIEALSGVKRLLRTPKQKTEPVDVLLGIKRLMKTPKQKTEPVDALSGVKRLMKTPKQKTEPVDALSGVKRLMKTPKQKTEPVDVLSGIKRLMKTPKQKTEPVDALSGVKRLMKTPKEKTEPIEALSGVKRLMKTPKQKTEPIEALSGVKKLLRTPKQNKEPVVDEICTKPVISVQMLRTVTNNRKKQREQPMEGNVIAEEVKEILKPLKDMESIQLKIPKERFGSIDDMVGINQVLKQRRQTFPSTSDCVGLQAFVTGLKKSYSSPEIDCTGGKEMLDTADEPKAELSESVNVMEDNGFWINSRKLDSMENVSENCNAKQEVTSKRESPLPVSRNSSRSVPNNMNHASFNEFKKESDEGTTGTISGSYKPGGIDPNEFRFDFVKEPVANPDAVNTENFEPLVLKRGRRGKIDNSNSVQCTEMVQRFMKNTHRTTSANCVNTNEIFDRNIAEVSPVHVSESNILAVETENKESQRERSKESSVKTNGNIKSNKIRHNQELQKPLKETTVEKQPRVNRSRMAAKRNGQDEVNKKENGPTEESEGHLIVKRALRSRDEKNSKTDLKSTFTQDKISCETSGVESIKENGRRKATRQAVLETLNTTFNEHKQGRQKYNISMALKTESSENNPTEVKDILVRKGKRKRVHFSLQKNNSELFEECALGYQNNSHEEASTYLPAFNSSFVQEKYRLEIQTEKNDNGTLKVSLESMQTHAEHNSQGREKTAKGNPPRRGRSKKAILSPSFEFDKPMSVVEDHNMTVTVKEKQSKRGRGRKIAPKHVALENIISGEEASLVNSLGSAEERSPLPQVQSENIREAQKMPLESVHILEKHIPPDNVIEENPSRREKTTKENPPRRGRTKKAIPSSSIEFDNQPSSGVDHNLIVTVKENQSKRARGRKIAQKPVALENGTSGEEIPVMNSFISAQKTGSLPQVQNEDVREAQKIPLESVHILEKHIPPDSEIEENLPRREKTVKENPPRRGRTKKAIPSSSIEFDNQPSSSVDHNLIVTVKGNQSKRARGRKIAQKPVALENGTSGEEIPVMNSFISAQKTGSLPQVQNEDVREAQKIPLESVCILEKHIPPEENPRRRGRTKQVCSDESSNKQAADVKEPNIVLIQEDYQSKRGRGKKIIVFQVPLPLENITVSKGNPIMNNGSDFRQHTQNEENPTATQDILLKNEQMVAESTSEKCLSIAKEIPLRRGRCKKPISCEAATECNSEEITNIEDCNIVNKNTYPEKESQLKMNRGKKIASISQELLKNPTFPFVLSKGENSSEQPDEALGTASNANESLSHKCSRRKTDYDVSASSDSSTNNFKLLDNYIQEKQLKDLETVEKQKITRNKRKQFVSDETSTESNGQLGIDSKKTKPLKDKVDLSGNSFEKMNLSKRRREETVNASLVSPLLNVSITLSPVSLDKGEAANENQSGSAKHIGVYNIMTRSVRGKSMQPKEKVLPGNQNKDLEETAMANKNIPRRGRRKVNKLEADITSLKEKCVLSAGSVISVKNEVIILNEKVSNKDSLIVKKKKFQDIKNMTQNCDQSTSFSYDQNKNLEHSNLLKPNSSSRRGKRKQINHDSETNANIGKENESTVSKIENSKRTNKKKIKENATSVTDFSGETEGKTRASKRTKK